MATNLPASELPQYVARCLADGFTQAQVAASLGVSESYISQVCTEHSITVQPQMQFADIDALYEDIERTALKALRASISQATKPLDLLRIATAVNATKRRSVGTTLTYEQKVQQETLRRGVVHLALPSAVASQFILNERNEAVGWTTPGEAALTVASSTDAASDAASSVAASSPASVPASSAPAPAPATGPAVRPLLTASSKQLADLAAAMEANRSLQALPPSAPACVGDDEM